MALSQRWGVSYWPIAEPAYNWRRNKHVPRSQAAGVWAMLACGWYVGYPRWMPGSCSLEITLCGTRRW